MPPAARVCLNMIVKNESRIIERCLASVLPLIDCYVIGDTGSTDATMEVIRGFFSRHQVPGEIHSFDFVNFEQARNTALDLCRTSALTFDYILLTDADMELMIDQPQVKSLLSAPAYSVRQSNQLSYFNVRLLQRKVGARYIGVTHEYLHVDAPAARLEGLWFHDHACGASRSEKFERDIALLRKALDKEPNNTRYMFYLAQSYKDSGQYQQAIQWYEHRAAAGGWEEEVWYAKYMLALCYRELGDSARFVQACMDAYSYRPARAESLHALAQHYRLRSQHDACMMFCEIGESIPYPADDRLFINDFIYRNGFLEEMSICGYYSPLAARRRKGYDACMHLATSREASPSTRQLARRNLAYYARPAGELYPDYRTRELTLEVDSGYAAMNPSLAWHDGRLFGIVRTVNYVVENGKFVARDPDSVVRTRNYFVELDDEFTVMDRAIMEDRAQDSPRSRFPVQGFEDCRLFAWRGKLWASCTVRDRNPEGRCQIALLELDEDRCIGKIHLNSTMAADRHQKNWVPLVRDDELHFIYSTDPTVVLRFDWKVGQPRPFRESSPPWALDHFRGGSPAVSVDGGWLYLIHETTHVSQSQRCYLHRFVQLDGAFNVTGISEPFFFMEKGIEFCAGLVRDRARQRLVASFGINEARACLAFFDEASVLAGLKRSQRRSGLA